MLRTEIASTRSICISSIGHRALFRIEVLLYHADQIGWNRVNVKFFFSLRCWCRVLFVP